MKETLEHIAAEHTLGELEESFLQNISTPLQPSKQEAWEALSARIDFEAAPTLRPKVRQLSFWKYAAAAALLMFLGAGFWARTHTEVVYAKAGQTVCLLPDGSEVELNTKASLTYKPYWWLMNRTVVFEGEAYFQVEKGSNFKVISAAGTTQVLGTSFTINASEHRYEVFCETGRVRVQSVKSQVELAPGEFAELDENDGLRLRKDKTVKDVLYWSEQKMCFEKSPLQEVLARLAERYDVEIEYESLAEDSFSYTGFFTKPDEVEDALHIVSLSLGLSFEKVENERYKVSK